MKIYLSINNKFMSNSPLELIKAIEEYDVKKSIKGLEIFYTNNKEEQEYYNELIRLALEHNYEIQFHGDSTLNTSDIYKYLDNIENLANTYDRKFNVVLHPISTNDIDKDLKESNIYFSNVLNYIYNGNYHINISIENLNSTKDMIRCSKEDVVEIVSNNEDLLFTYDIGHEISNYGNITDLDILLINRLCNVHIHTFNYYEDHQKIIDSDEYKEKWIKGILFLKSISYEGPLVLEFDFNKLGNTYFEKIIEYIKISSYLEEYL